MRGKLLIFFNYFSLPKVFNKLYYLGFLKNLKQFFCVLLGHENDKKMFFF